MSTYAEKVNSLAAQVDESGKLPEGVELDEGLQFAVDAEVRRRNTQSAYTKSQQQIKTLTAENTALASNWEKDAVANLSTADRVELEELKVQDPDAWRSKLTELENQNIETVKARRTEITQEATKLTAIEQRQADLVAFNEANPDFAITDEVIENDVPPRIVKKLENGELTFSEFLEAAKAYVEAPKTIQKTEAPNEPNFAKARGGQEPTATAKSAQSSQDYKTELY